LLEAKNYMFIPIIKILNSVAWIHNTSYAGAYSLRKLIPWGILSYYTLIQGKYNALANALSHLPFFREAETRELHEKSKWSI
jgi:hypothetical protein